MWRNMCHAMVSTNPTAPDTGAEEMRVNDCGIITIPASLRRRPDIVPGDMIRWGDDADGDLSVEVVQQRYGAFNGSGLASPLGGHGLGTQDLAGHEANTVFED